jgi:hypothetical protein
MISRGGWDYEHNIWTGGGRTSRERRRKRLIARAIFDQSRLYLELHSLDSRQTEEREIVSLYTAVLIMNCTAVTTFMFAIRPTVHYLASSRDEGFLCPC